MGAALPEVVVELMATVADTSRTAVERLRAADSLRETLETWLPSLAEAALHISRQAAQQRFGGPRRKQALEAWNTDPRHGSDVANRHPG